MPSEAGVIRNPTYGMSDLRRGRSPGGGSKCRGVLHFIGEGDGFGCESLEMVFVFLSELGNKQQQGTRHEQSRGRRVILPTAPTLYDRFRCVAAPAEGVEAGNLHTSFTKGAEVLAGRRGEKNINAYSIRKYVRCTL